MNTRKIEELKVLLERGATESLDLELKQWLDPQIPQDRAKIAKACLALRNNNGGVLVIGFKDDGTQDSAVPPCVRTVFSSDLMQEIVSKYASDPFAIDVSFVHIRGVEHPVIDVPSGVRIPVVAKSDLANPDSREKPLIRDNALYVRSITANQRVSSTEIRKGDWERLLSICFDNREADIARFVRRHLIDILNPQLLAEASGGLALLTKANGLLDEGNRRFVELSSERDTSLPTGVGFREFAVKVIGEDVGHVPTQSLLYEIYANMPRVSGWSPWEILLGASDSAIRPTVNDGAWECYIDCLTGGFGAPHLDYWWLNPSGEYYHIRALEDDFAQVQPGLGSVVPGTQLDFVLQICRIAEAIVVAQAIAKALGFNPEICHLSFATRWMGLKGRHLTSWADPRRNYVSRDKAVQDVFLYEVNIPLNTPQSDIHVFVKLIIDSLFATFGGAEIDAGVLESIVTQCLDRNW